jgi:hypothetical protein
MPFALMNEPSQSEVSEAINYLLANFGSNIAADPNTGEISGPSGIVIAYLYRYLAVKYADSFDGSVNFGDSPTNRLYYGLRNSDDPTESTNFADYIWFKVAGAGFGTTNFLWYQANGGRQIDFFVGTAAPSASYLQAPSTSIDLDTVTGTSGKMYAAPTIYIWTANSTPPTRPSTTSTYTWATGAFTPPAGWSAQIPNNTTAGSYLWALAVPLIESVNTVTSVIDWTNVAYPIVSISINGSTGADGTRSSSGFVYYGLASNSAPAAPTLSGFNFVTGTFSTISANWSTTFTAPAATSTTQFWAVRYSVSEATFGGTQTVTVSSVFNWTNFNGLVTFTNLATNTGTTFIDGGNITTNTITVDRLIAGLLEGYTLRTGTGGAPGGSAFYVSSSGVVYVDNMFGGIGLFDNSRYVSSNSLYAATQQPKEAIYGQVSGFNSSAFAHGIRGISSYNNTSGLIAAANGYDFYADGAGTNYGPFTGNHDFLLPIDQTLTEGDLVVDVTCIARNGWSNAIFQVAKSTLPNQAGARGIFVGELRPLSSVKPPVFIDHWVEEEYGSVPVMTAQYEAIKDSYWFGSMSSLGEGQINVCGENGNLSVDTLIVSSSTAGVGMAQSDDIIRGKTVAKSREAVTFASPTEIKQVACIYVSG